MKFNIKTLIVVIASYFAINFSALSEVSLIFDDFDAIPTATSIDQGDSFSFTIRISSTQESLVALTYFLEVDNAGAGFFWITGRDITGSVFPDTTFNNGTVLGDPSRILNPTNDNDLGGVVASSAVPPGLNTVAILTLQSSALIPIGSYVITFSSLTSAGDDDFNDISPVKGTYSVTVIPEPTAAILFGLGLLSLVARRRR